MLNPNSFQLARIIHERQVQEAIDCRRHRSFHPRSNGWVAQLRFNLGNRLIELGVMLRQQATTTAPSKPVVT